MTAPVAAPDAVVAAVLAVQQARRIAVELAAKVGRAREDFETANADLLREAKLARDVAERAEENCRVLALAAYQRNGERRPAPGVEIKLYREPHFEEATALNWARQAGVAVLPERLDTKAFLKIAQSSGNALPFVTWTDQPEAQLAKDLDKALASAGVAAADPAS
ncbi:MAG TPA: hypothetical protein VJN95_08885 [Gemmatimonadales bacterium]|nr:hypothetical protein [Gemmatimonadales bacterium]